MRQIRQIRDLTATICHWMGVPITGLVLDEWVPLHGGPHRFIYDHEGD